MRPGYDNPRVLVLSRTGERLGRRWIDVAPVYLKVEGIPLCVFGSETRPLHLNSSVSRSRNRESHETIFPGVVGRELSTRRYFRRSLSLA
jgi:hypothetical protein